MALAGWAEGRRKRVLSPMALADWAEGQRKQVLSPMEIDEITMHLVRLGQISIKIDIIPHFTRNNTRNTDKKHLQFRFLIFRWGTEEQKTDS